MHRQEILAQIREIATELDANIDLGSANSTAAKAAATKKLDELKVSINTADAKLFVDMYQILVDSDVISANKSTVGFLTAYAESLKKALPALEVHITNRRAIPQRLLKYILVLSNIKLAELIKSSKKDPKPEWLDPVTASIMNIPVSYTVGRVEYTVDLFTLLNNSNQSLSLRCPLTKQSVFLADLRPRIDLVMQIQAACNVRRVEARNDQEQFLASVKFIKENNLEGLKQQYDELSDMKINKYFAELNNDTLLHHACRLNRFDIAIWLLNNQASIAVRNNNQKVPGLLMDPERLNAAIAANPDEAGLIYLRAISHFDAYNAQSASKEHQDEFYDNLELAVTKKFIPAMIHRATALCTYDEPRSVVKGIKMLRDALRLNCGFAAIVLHQIFTTIIPANPLVKMMLENERTNVMVVDATNPEAFAVNSVTVDNGDNAVNLQTVTRDLLAVLSSDENIFGRTFLETKAAEMLYETHHNDRSQRGYAKVTALCLASNAVANGKDEARELLSKLMTLLGVQKIGQAYLAKIEREGLGPLMHSEVVIRCYDLGTLKPWVPLSFKYGS